MDELIAAAVTLLLPFLEIAQREILFRLDSYGKGIPAVELAYWMVRSIAEGENTKQMTDEEQWARCAEALKIDRPDLSTQTIDVLIAAARKRIQTEAIGGQ